MALIETPQTSGGIWNALKGSLNLFSGLNKAEGVGEISTHQPTDEYESKLSDTEILELTAQWKRVYRTYYDEIEPTQKLAWEYWIGKHRQEEPSQLQAAVDARPPLDNQIFPAIEIFLPIATRANPDPLVEADPTPIGLKFAKDIKAALVHEADVQKLRMKLKRLCRHWVLNRIGVAKVVYDPIKDELDTKIIHPKKMYFDKDGYIDEAGRFVGEYLGEKKKVSASKLIELFPKKKAEITIKADGKLATKIDYDEWWYKKSEVFYCMEGEVLGKFKNPNWNYDGTVKTIDPITQQLIDREIKGRNHFTEMQYPYIFMGVFSTGTQPHDETSLVLQNVSTQDLINRRWRQIDKNVDAMNNGMVVDGEKFTEEQASQAAAALRRGTAIRVPTPKGNIQNAVMRFPAPELPVSVFNNLKDARNELANIFGTSGSSPQNISKEDTVRGKILINQMDSSRIGGGVTEYLEQVADTIYNTWVQMMFVFYNNEHYVNAIGTTGGSELIVIKNTNFPAVNSLTITVKEGSLIPKDPLTQRNEAMDLWSANAIDPISFYAKLDFPDPQEAAKQLIIWQQVQRGVLPPQMYIPDFPMPTQTALPQQGVGGQAVNPLGSPTNEEVVPNAPTSPQAVAEQSRQLLNQIKV